MPEFATASIFVNLIIFVASFYVLIKGSDLFVEASVTLARIFKISELIIGLTLVSIGTSLPELASSVYAAFLNQPDFVIGNVIGSCTTNITAMLGVAIVIGGTLHFPSKLFNRDALLMFALFIACSIVAYAWGVKLPNGEQAYGFSKTAGVLLLLGGIAYCYYLLKHPEELKGEISEHEKPLIEKVQFTPQILPTLTWLLIGFLLLLVSSKGLVDTVAWGARQLNISQIVISGTIVAFGTSVPELAVTVAGVLKGRSDLAIGNIIGSCIFNLFLIIGFCAIITPLTVSPTEGVFNFVFLLGSGLALVAFMFTLKRLIRWEGVALLVVYGAYLAYNLYFAHR